MGWKVEAQNLSLKYKKVLALDNLSFTLEEGKIYGLLGRNGAGKTSLLSLLASYREPTSGRILVDNQEPFENSQVMEQICLMHEKDYKEDTSKVRELLETVESYRPHYDKEFAMNLIEKFKLPLNKQVSKLSKGMQSALNVTMGLASRCPITILDEVYLGMDAPTREIFYKELLADQEKHPRTFIISTHLVSEMDYLFDEILILNKGKLLLQEDYETFVSRGVSVTGSAEEVDKFALGMQKLNEQRLGNTKSVMIYGSLNEKQLEDAQYRGLQISNVSLQDLFIYLTKEEDL